MNGGARRFVAAWLLALSCLVAGPTQAAPDIEQRVAACIACHGRAGAVTAAAYYPRLAGKPAGYLFHQLQSFRDGRRFNADMSRLVRNLPDAYLREMAEYFAGLDLPYPPIVAADDAPTSLLARGEALVRTGDPGRGIPACASCHGSALTGVQPGIPGLLGLPRLYIASQLGDWLEDHRRAPAPDCMSTVGRKLTSADISAVASWLALQPVPAGASAAAAPPAPLPLPCSAMQAEARP